jgi:hypothetical protein
MAGFPTELFWRFVTGITPEERKKLIDRLPTSATRDISPDEEINILKRAMTTAPEQMQKAMEGWGKKPANASWLQGQGITGMLKGLAGDVAQAFGTGLGLGQKMQRLPMDALGVTSKSLWNYLANRPPRMETLRGPISPVEGGSTELLTVPGGQRHWYMDMPEEQPVTQAPQPTPSPGIFSRAFWEQLAGQRGVER